jgi:hypothetical protein
MQTTKVPIDAAPQLIEHWCHIAERERVKHAEYLNRIVGETQPHLCEAYELLAAQALKLSKAMHDDAGQLLKAFEEAGGMAPRWISNQFADRHH